MSAPLLHLPSSNCLSSSAQENRYGETPLPNAPRVLSKDGARVVPQQFLDVNRTLENLETILSRIELPEGFQLFAGQEGSVLSLVVCGLDASAVT